MKIILVDKTASIESYDAQIKKVVLARWDENSLLMTYGTRINGIAKDLKTAKKIISEKPYMGNWLPVDMFLKFARDISADEIIWYTDSDGATEYIEASDALVLKQKAKTLILVVAGVVPEIPPHQCLLSLADSVEILTP